MATDKRRQVTHGWNVNSKGVVYWRDGQGGIAYLDGSYNARVEAENDLKGLLNLRARIERRDNGPHVARG